MATVYPFTNFTIIDNSQIPQLNEPTVSRPNYLCPITADKGPEKLVECTYANFHKYFGDDISFAKHGQPLLQAAIAADNGAIVYCRRLVADDATLANAVVFATVTQGTEEQKTDDRGNKLFTHTETGNVVTEAQKDALLAKAEADGSATPNFSPIMIKPALIKYEAKSYEGCKTMEEIATKADQEKTDEKFPLFIVADNGRGVSKKSFAISPDYKTSQTRNYMRYKVYTLEDGEVQEAIPFCANHYIIENKRNKSIATVCKNYSTQIQAYQFEEHYDEFIKMVAKTSGKDEKYCNTHDLIFGYTVNQKKLDGIRLATDTISLGTIVGIPLENGTNGAFGDAPFGTDAYKKQLVKFFSGEIDEDIYDVDNYKFDILLDANYPAEAKRAMESLNLFRKDAMVMVDGGITGLNSIEDILMSAEEVTKSYYVMYYPIYYDIIDPYSGKQITVTSNYAMATLMIPHFMNNNRHRPMAGQLNGFIITDMVEDTYNFIPKNLPSGNQKEIFSENRINHLGKYGDIVTFESVWTTQIPYTQLSFGNNLLSIQEVIKAIRDFCPANRFSIMYEDDIQGYTEDIEDILANYKDNFADIQFVYLADEDLEANKIYGAAIQVTCRNFNIAEDFKIYVY